MFEYVDRHRTKLQRKVFIEREEIRFDHLPWDGGS